MRRVLIGLLAITAALSCAAKVAVLPQLPQGELPDSEVVTNITLAANLANLEVLRFTLEFEPNASNELAVAVGADADGNGDLSLEEAAVVFGCDCGGWYRVDGAAGSVSTSGLSSTVEINKRDFDLSWNLVKVLHRGLGVFAETVTQEDEGKKFIIHFR